MKTNSSTTTIGLDLGDRKHSVCVLDAAGKIAGETTIANTREAMTRFSRKHPGALVVMEVGMQSPWISRFFSGLGHRVLVANPRKVRAIWQNDRKCDRKDAVMLARLARADESLLSPVRHGTEQAQLDLLQIKLRDNLVRQRVDVISAVRFTLKSLGIRLRSPNTVCFARLARRELAGEHASTLALVEPSLAVIDAMSGQIKALDRAIETLAAESYPETEFLTQITGVGTITSLTFILTIGDPDRFRRTRDVAAYLGLVPKRDQSGGTDKQLRISKAGSSYLRRLLVSAAQYVLGPFGPDCLLKRQGLKLAERGGPRAKKKAVVAIARKLAVLLLSLWKNEQIYRPLRHRAA
jgi:transposase